MIKNLWSEISYYLWDIPRDWYYKIKWFLINLWKFKKVIWDFRPWDWYYCVNTFTVTLEQLRDCIKNGHEETRSRLKKVSAIEELIKELKWSIDDSDFGLEEDFTNDKLTLKDYNKLYNERKKECFDKIYRLIYGQEDLIDPANYDNWVENFDGTGCNGWWD